ncbi:MAG: Gfo/Idh/MocA family protein [Gemmataceae bacterium]
MDARQSHPPATSRRDFLKTSAIVGTGLAAFGAVPQVHAGGSDVLRIGLIGCGGRGTGAAAQALNADPNTRLTALGDAFADRLEKCLSGLQGDADLSGRVEVPPERRFVGFDAYKQVIDSGVDVVLLAEPPHFRPAHLEYAVAQNKHVFAEKPVAVDGPGVRRVLATCAEAKKKGLSIVSGLCWRYHQGMRQTMQQVHEGAIGDIAAIQCNYLTGYLWHRDRLPGMTDMEWQMRNWLYFTWLSGDFNVEQHVHSLDKAAWAMKDEYPVKAIGLGGRQVRTDAKYGHIFDHHSVVYEYANGVKCFAHCRQQDGCAKDVMDYIIGTEGTCETIRYTITGKNPWKAERASQRDNMYQREHNELFASIRHGKPINNGDYMTKSSLMAIMGRMATYTGQVITWDMALNSQEDLTPPRYDWNVELPMPPVARPGITKFV